MLKTLTIATMTFAAIAAATPSNAAAPGGLLGAKSSAPASELIQVKKGGGVKLHIFKHKHFFHHPYHAYYYAGGYDCGFYYWKWKKTGLKFWKHKYFACHIL